MKSLARLIRSLSSLPQLPNDDLKSPPIAPSPVHFFLLSKPVFPQSSLYLSSFFGRRPSTTSHVSPSLPHIHRPRVRPSLHKSKWTTLQIKRAICSADTTCSTDTNNLSLRKTRLNPCSFSSADYDSSFTTTNATLTDTPAPVPRSNTAIAGDNGAA